MTLLQYINTDPDDLGLAAMVAEGSHEGIAQAINEPRFPNGFYISRDDLEVFAIGDGIAAAAELTAQNAEAPTQLRAACLSFTKLLASSRFPKLRLDAPSTLGMRAAFVAAGIMTQEQDDALGALGEQYIYSVAEREKFGSVTAASVSIALEGGA